jgi:membrane fusion protein, multidrug efflux system
VFVLDSENKATVRPVRTGEWIGQDWLVLDGLRTGERVVVDNLMKLRPGATVAPQLADAGPAAGSAAPGAPQQPAGKAPAAK